MLTEQYRPKGLDEIVGQDKAVKVCHRLTQRGIGGRAFWISGASGTGKTTLARIIARSMADQLNVEEIDGGELTVPKVDEIKGKLYQTCLGSKRGRAYIVNEAHGLSPTVIRRLLTLLEALPGHTLFVFTTTHVAQKGIFDQRIDASPLLSRCIEVRFTTQGLAKVYAEHVKRIAMAEGLDGRAVEAYVALAQECHNNMRAMLQKVESGVML